MRAGRSTRLVLESMGWRKNLPHSRQLTLPLSRVHTLATAQLQPKIVWSRARVPLTTWRLSPIGMQWVFLSNHHIFCRYILNSSNVKLSLPEKSLLRDMFKFAGLTLRQIPSLKIRAILRWPMMAVPLPRDVEKLLSQYLDPLSSSHLLSTQDRLLKNIQRDSELYPMSVDTIQNFKQGLEWESKMREYKLLRGKKRYLSYRRYITFDNSMLAGLNNKPILSFFLSIYLSIYLSTCLYFLTF